MPPIINIQNIEAPLLENWAEEHMLKTTKCLRTICRMGVEHIPLKT
jgi:hypothetical protein